MLSVGATYFDGYSSIPQQIELRLEDELGQLSFSTPFSPLKEWKIINVSYEKFGDTLEIRYSQNKKEVIKINNQEFTNQFLIVLKKHGKISFYKRFIHLGFKAHLTIVGFLAVFGLLFYFLIIPFAAEKAVKLIPEQYDTTLGNNFYHKYTAENLVDDKKSVALNDFASHLKLGNNKKLSFSVIDSPEVNAFALPDGNIIVFRGLLNLIQNYNELACLIGHEVIHVNSRHSMKILCRNLSGYLFLSVIIGDPNGITSVIARNANNLQSLAYSRQFEKEADEQGTELMIENNIDPHGMTSLFERLNSSDKQILPTFISSHPMTVDRISYIDKLIKDKAYSTNKNAELELLFNKIKNTQ